MAEIAGFHYEKYESSSRTAHRDFQHTTTPEDFEKTPHKKWGKNHDKPSPNNKRGCEGNDGGAHIYEKVRINKEWFNPFLEERRTYSYVVNMCIGCNTRNNRKLWRYDGPVYSEIDEKDDRWA